MRVLVACECSGIVRDAFRRRGHDAMSCDLKPTERPGPHHVGDVLDIIADGWDLLVAHPECTYLCSSGLHWNKRRPGRECRTEVALGFVRALMVAPIKRKAIENPVGCIGTRIRKADQIIQPYQFGDDASKATGLWLFNLPLLRPTRFVEPCMVDCGDGKGGAASLVKSDRFRAEPSRARRGSRDRSRQNLRGYRGRDGRAVGRVA